MCRSTRTLCVSVLGALCGVMGLVGAATAQSGCPCDWNGADGLDSQDYFDFAESFFDGDADINGDTVTDSQDFFDFLECFFNNCPDAPPAYLGHPNPHLSIEHEAASPCPAGCADGREPRGVGDLLVHLFSGEFRLTAVDLRVKGRGMDFVWARTYRSQLGPDGVLGVGWDYSYNIVVRAGDGDDLILHNGMARDDTYVFDAAQDGWVNPAFQRVITRNPDGTFVCTFPDSGRWELRSLTSSPAGAAGKISRIVERNGNAIAFVYQGTSGRLTRITDTLGRDYTLQYSNAGPGGEARLTRLTDFTGRQVRYTYYGASNPGGDLGDMRSSISPLVTGTVTGNDFPLGKETFYTYAKDLAREELNHNLLAVTDPRGSVVIENEYNATTNAASPGFDRVVRQRVGGPGDDFHIVYVPQTPDGSNNFATIKAIVNDRLGRVKEVFFDGTNSQVMLREYTGQSAHAATTDTQNRPGPPLRPGDPALFETRWSYGAPYLVTRLDLPAGNAHTWAYDSVNPDWRLRGNLLQHCRMPGAIPSDQASICETFTYIDGFGACCGGNFVATYTDGRGNVTSHEYDARGNRLRTTNRIPSIIEEWRYNAFGQVTRHVLPDNGTAGGYRRVDAMEYYGPVDGPQNGYLRGVTVDVPHDQPGDPPDPPAVTSHFALGTRYEYDARGNAVRVIDPRGNDALTTYNALDEVIRTRSRAVDTGTRVPVRYGADTIYDANGNVVRVEVENIDKSGDLDPANPTWTTLTEYGPLNEMVRESREIEPGRSAVEEYVYDANRNRVLVRHGEATGGNDPANTDSMTYDERDLVLTMTRGAGSGTPSTARRDYDANGNLVRLVSGLEAPSAGGVTRTAESVYDGYDRRVRTTDPMGNVGASRYDANGNIVSSRAEGQLMDVPGSAGNVRLAESAAQFDAMDRRTRTDRAHFDAQTQALIGDGLARTVWVYNADSSTRTATDDNGRATSYEYDSAGRLLRRTDPEGNSSTSEYDEDSNNIEVVELDRSGLGAPDQMFGTQYEYDGLNRLVRTVDPDGGAVEFRYDSRGNRVLVVDAAGAATRYEYDGLGRAVRTVRDMDGDGPGGGGADIVTAQTWDDSSRLTGQTDDNGSTTRYAYDSLNRPIVTRSADGTLAQIGSGAAWSDGAPAPDLSGFATGYDAHSDQRRRTDADGSVVDTVYDDLSRPISRAVARGPGVRGTTGETYQYDGLSRLIRAQDNDALVTRGSATTSGHDSLGNILRETQRILSPLSPIRTVTAEYDGVGNRTCVGYPGGRQTCYVYDGLNRAVEVADAGAPGSPVATYVYVGRTRVERRDYGNGTRYEPEYDAVRRVARTLHTRISDGALVDDRRYDWDVRHNRTALHNDASLGIDQRGYTYDAASRLVGSDWGPTGPITGYALDGAGNRVSVAGGPDAGLYTMDPGAPEAADAPMNQYTTTPFDVRAYDRNGNTLSSSDGPKTFAYDYRNQLVEFTDAGAARGAPTVATYQYDALGRRVASTVNGVTTRFCYTGSVEIEEQVGGVTTATYVHGSGGRTLLQMRRPGRDLYFHHDEQGSVVKVTDAAADIAGRAEYDDYGRPVEADDPGGSFFQTPDQRIGYVSDAEGDPPPLQVLADDVRLDRPAVLTGLRWWGIYSGDLIMSDQFLLTVYDDADGRPGATVFQEFIGTSAARHATGALVGASFRQEFEYQYTLTAPLPLASLRRYWVSVRNFLPGPARWGWESSGLGNALFAFTQDLTTWTPSGDDVALELTLSIPPAVPPENPYGFTGQRLDAESGLYHFMARYYDPRAGRFISRDPIGVWGDCVNMGNGQAYAGDSPTSKYDPDGRQCTPKLVEGKADYDQYKVGTFPSHFDMEAWWTPTDSSLTVRNFTFGKAYRVFWVRWGRVDITTVTTIHCDEKGSTCKARAETNGTPARTDSIISGVIEPRGTPDDNCISIAAIVSSAMYASGGPSFELGAGGHEGAVGGKISVTWPDASYQNTFLRSFRWCCNKPATPPEPPPPPRVPPDDRPGVPTYDPRFPPPGTSVPNPPSRPDVPTYDPRFPPPWLPGCDSNNSSSFPGSTGGCR